MILPWNSILSLFNPRHIKGFLRLTPISVGLSICGVYWMDGSMWCSLLTGKENFPAVIPRYDETSFRCWILCNNVGVSSIFLILLVTFLIKIWLKSKATREIILHRRTAPRILLLQVLLRFRIRNHLIYLVLPCLTAHSWQILCRDRYFKTTSSCVGFKG